ncbi:hypothetical protein BD01_1672 [Thermococcus nautili]|uniref:Uncharacterized protein n=1 Tax=Thermococcus nautili TaxID=195522 RepID=W8P6Y5_9EURY|nr:hypothetical protein BD01_1672 [Thermococcus nautili]
MGDITVSILLESYCNVADKTTKAVVYSCFNSPRVLLQPFGSFFICLRKCMVSILLESYCNHFV